MKRILILLIDGYKIALSPFFGSQCRFYPSCADYAQQAIASHGVARGSLLACRRVCKCHPWNAGGFDPVPATHPHADDHPTMTRQRH